MKYEISTTQTFNDWVKNLKDRQAALLIAKRLDRALKGNLGDVENVGGGVFEMRIFIGCGYRLYFTFKGAELIILLCGGDKSTQKRDIAKAKEMAKNV
ncbi:MAG: type II toxin-antitoxin system RelE/ParE family toxin [Methylococcales bacterium]|nr:type II toxin-antitoxin system RelE/ParE family toxin [Methylococcales bacterium]